MEGSTLSQLIDGLEHQNMIPSQMNTALVSTDVEEPSDTSEGYSELISQDEGDLEVGTFKTLKDTFRVKTS